MTNTYKRVSAALLSVLLLCMFTFGASAASSLNVVTNRYIIRII